VDQSEAPGQPILLRKRGDALMRAYSTGTDLIGSLRPGVVVAAAEDDYVVLWSGGNRFTVFLDGGSPLAEFSQSVDGFDQAKLVAQVWLEAFRRGADYVGGLVDA